MQPSSTLRLSLTFLAVASTAVGGCREERAGRTDSAAVTIDSGSLSPVLSPQSSPELADTTPKTNAARQTATADTGRARQSTTSSAPAPATSASGTPSANAPPPAGTPAAPTPAPAPAKIADAADPAHVRDSTPTPIAAVTKPFEKAAAPASRYHFARGEKFDYQVKFGPVSVGNATMEVLGIDTLRGIPAYHALFSVRGGITFYKVNDRYESWFNPQTFASLRFVQNIDEGNYEKQRTYEIFPERQSYSENGKPEQPSVSDPLDEASLLYLLRAMPLEVGKTYDLNRYFRPDRNPVRVNVVRKERITVPAGTFDCIVVRPTIQTKGIFSEGGHAEVWFTDDSVRTMVQMKSKLSFGSLNLYLKSAHPGERTESSP